MNVIGSHASESVVVHTLFAVALSFSKHRTESEEVHVRLFSIDVQLVTPTETHYSRILLVSFAIT